MSQISFPGHNGGGGGTAQSQVTAVNSDLLASLFDSVTKEKPAKDISNQSTSYSFIGAKKHDTNSRKTITSSICNGKNQLTRYFNFRLSKGTRGVKIFGQKRS